MSRTLKDFVTNLADDLFIRTSDKDIPTVKRYINRAYFDLCIRERIEKKIPVTAVDGRFAKPIDFIKGYELYHPNIDTPIKFWEEADNIVSEYSGDLTFVYNYQPSALTADADTPITNPANDEFILDNVKFLWYSRENKKEYKAEIHKRNYESMRIKTQKKNLKVNVER